MEAHDMATLYSRKGANGVKRYYSNLSIRGKRIRQFLSTDKETARVALVKLEYDLLIAPPKAPEPEPMPGISLGEAKLSFLAELYESGVVDKYADVIARTIKRFTKHRGLKANTELCTIKPDHLLSYISTRKATKTTNLYQSTKDGSKPRLKPSTINKEIQYLKRFFHYCQDMEWIERNPARALKLMKAPPSHQRYTFSNDDLELILKSGNKHLEFYLVLLHTGLRASDTFYLQRKHIEDGQLHIQMHKTSDWLHVPLNLEALSVLNKRLGSTTKENDFIFPEYQSEKQRRQCRWQLQSMFEREKVRENRIALHTFRHTYAHQMLANGMPKEVLQTFLGHRSVRTTEIYANWVTQNELRKWI